MAIKIGDTVDFKYDYEGQGEVLEIKRDRTFGYKDYLIAVTKKGSRDAYPAHAHASYNRTHECMAIWVDEDHVWEMD